MNIILVFPPNYCNFADKDGGCYEGMFFNLCIAFQVSGGVNREIKRIHIAVFQTDERAQSAN